MVKSVDATRIESDEIGERPQDRPVKVEIKDGTLLVTLEDGRLIGTPLDWYPVLIDANKDELSHIELSDDGLHWPDLDEDLSIKGMLKGNKAPHWKRGEWQARLAKIKSKHGSAR